MSRVESLPNRTKPRINHRAGVSSRSRARSSSHLGAYKVFVFAQIPSQRILQRLLQRPHGRLFQVCAADDVREQSRDLALACPPSRRRVRSRPWRARGFDVAARARRLRRIATGPASFFSNGQIFRSVAALELFAHTTPRSIARAEVSRARRVIERRARSPRIGDDWTIRARRRRARRRARERRATTRETGENERRCATAPTRGTMRLTFYTKMGGRLTPRRAAGRSGEREAP